MNNLKCLTLNSKEVAEMLGKRHDHLVRDIEIYAGYLTQPSFGVSDFFEESSYKDKTGRKCKCYLVTKKGCEFLAHKMTGAKGALFTAAYINRFYEMEDKLNESSSFNTVLPDFTKPAVAARAWANEYEGRVQAEHALEKQKPKVLFADSVSTSHTNILIGELAKIIKQNGHDIGQNRLFTWLRKNGYLISRNGTDYNMPTQKSMEAKLFAIKETVINHADGHTSVNKTPKVTGKGQIYFVNKFCSRPL